MPTDLDDPVQMTARQYFDEVKQLMDAVDENAVLRVVGLLSDARRRDACIYIVGNGGSAATCSHFANDLATAARASAGKPLRVFSLADNAAALTAISNDDCYERVFEAQLESYIRAGDVVVGISASGNSPNVLRAMAMAKQLGASTVGFSGFDGGELRGLVDESIWVASRKGAYGPVEDVHLMLQHLISFCIAQGHAPDAQSARSGALAECAV